MNKYCAILLLPLFFFRLNAAEYPSSGELWKSFNRTSGSRVHVNRVFVKPDTPALEGKKFKRQNERIASANVRYASRRKLRDKTLDRIWSNFVPGEKAFLVLEKYDLHHECNYTVYVLTQQNMYFAEVHEVPEKGRVIRKYPLPPEVVKRFLRLTDTFKPSCGSCDMIDSRSYPTFLSVRNRSGKWETAVCSAVNYTWKNPNEKQQEYFSSVSEFMRVCSELNYICDSCKVPPIVVRKK